MQSVDAPSRLALVSWAQVMLYSLILLVFGGFAVCLAVLLAADRYVMGHQNAFISLVLRSSPVGLVFPVLAIVPYTLAVLPAAHNRVLVYSRTRQDLRRTLRQLYVRAAVVTFVVFVLIMLIYQLGASVSAPLDFATYDPAKASTTPTEETTFSQLHAYGMWVYYAFLCMWFGVNGATYAVLGLSCLLFIRQPVIALLLPWIAFTVIGFGMAVLGLEAYSPYTITPSNLTQLPIWMPMVPAAVLLAVSVSSVILVTTQRDRLPVVA